MKAKKAAELEADLQQKRAKTEAEGEPKAETEPEPAAKKTEEAEPKPKPEPAEVEDWATDFKRKPTPKNTKRDAYEHKHTGPENVEVKGGGEKIWADGLDSENAQLLESKHVDKPNKSPFVPDSNVPDFIRNKIIAEVDDEFRRYGSVINDSTTPVQALEVITNSPEAVPFFEGLLKKHGIPGRVVVKD